MESSFKVLKKESSGRGGRGRQLGRTNRSYLQGLHEENKKQFIKVHREHSRTESGMKSPSTTASEPRNYIMNKSLKSFILFAPQNFLFSMTQAKGKKQKHNQSTGCNYLQNSHGCL